MALAPLHELPALRDRAPVFRDRAAAGAVLAQMLETYRGSGALVAGIPAGGVPVAAEIALRLELELEAMPVSKILFPWDTESGFGAVAFDGGVWVNWSQARLAGLSEKEVARCTAQARAKVERRIEELRGGRPFPQLAERAVIAVDDGIAAGSTLRVAIAALRRQQAREIVVAVPTGSARTVERIAEQVNALWCANVRSAARFAVADAYENWHDVQEDEVAAILARF
ncbi:MAG: phosphoribosyltransferase [Burkholderiales bacterium]